MPHYTRYELNITLACNAACHDCNRMCNVYKSRTEHMRVDQIEKFIDQLRTGLPIGTVKVVGGEPTVHPEFEAIYGILMDAVEEGLIRLLKISTNHVLPRPDFVQPHPRLRWMGQRPDNKKGHIPYTVSPLDFGLTPANPGWQCPVPRRCGASLDYHGWLPCSPGIMIARLWRLEHLYRKELPISGWGFDELCQHCVYSQPVAWQKTLALEMDVTVPSKTWREKMAEFDGTAHCGAY